MAFYSVEGVEKPAWILLRLHFPTLRR